MTFAAPISFFKSTSIIFGGAGLIFEGLTNQCGCGHEKFCQGLPGVNPQRSNQSKLLRNLFGEMLFQKERGTAFGLSTLAYGPEGVTLEGRKTAMAATRGVADNKGSMHTVLSVTKMLRANEGQSMLAGKRAIRVGDVLLKEMADLLMRRVKDPRVKGVTLTGIRVSNDLKHAKVYFSLIGDEKAIMEVQQGLESAKGFIKREIGLRMELKYIPDIVFKHDPTLATGERMEKLFQNMKAGRSSEFGKQEDPNGEGS